MKVSETFPILRLTGRPQDAHIDDSYLTAALDRHESLAANLGAKLTGPRILKGIERFFDGPIKTSASQPFASPVSWIDVVQFAKTSPDDFVLVALPDGSRCCRFHCKGTQVEITEDDWRLISSGALDRFPLEHPFEEDETAELATLDILDARTSILYKKADEIAARARILHHRMGQRRNELKRRRNNAAPASRTGPSGQPYDLHADLLQQFAAVTSNLTQSRSASIAGVSTPSMLPVSPSVHSPHHQHTPALVGRPLAPAASFSEGVAVSPTDHRAELMRSLVTQKMDRLAKGELITPPCDRCRRLRLQCVRNLTACQGCTKKHAKCSWKFVSEEEVARLKHEMGMRTDGDTDSSDMPSTREGHIARAVEGGNNVAPEMMPRPDSRTSTDARHSTYSPDMMSSARSDQSMENNRMSLPPLQGARRDPSRLNHILSTNEYYVPRPSSGLLGGHQGGSPGPSLPPIGRPPA